MTTTPGSVTKINRYALGARGIDRIERYADSATTYGYPIYDGHGNIRTTLAKSGSSYTTGTFKTYDVWGSLRSGGDSTDPKQKYCGSLGHVSDDESGLTYMRARYYEPSTGRFVSQDPKRSGWNWYSYCQGEPINYVDHSGTIAELDGNWLGMILLLHVGGAALMAVGSFVSESPTGAAIAFLVADLIAWSWAGMTRAPKSIGAAVGLMPIAYAIALLTTVEGGELASKGNGIAKSTVYYFVGYSILLIGLMFADILEAWGHP